MGNWIMKNMNEPTNSMVNTVIDKSGGILRIAVGLMMNQVGQVLIAKRPIHKEHGGKWEFPGGKIEKNESVSQALSRELFEELGIIVKSCEPFTIVEHRYEKDAVCLHVYRVLKFDNIPYGKEGQTLLWVNPSNLRDYEFPGANHAIITAITKIKQNEQTVAEKVP